MDSTEAAGSEPRVLLGRYRVERTLGRGGMGEVLLAYDELLHRRVALKRLIPEGENRAELRHAILREARRASRVTDRRVAQIYDVLDLPDEILLVMEYVEGTTLRERMRGPLALDEFWRLAPQCVEGVAAAHDHGVIHRDIKPENFIVTTAGEVKMLDFGIAKRSGSGLELGSTSTTGTDSASRIMGTPYYMAPEAYLGGRVDERTDIFSLGVVFYEMLTARRPFDGDNFAVVVNQVINATPTEVRELNPAVSASLSAVIGGMLAKNKVDRVETVATLRTLLAAAHGDPANTAALAAGERAEGSVVTVPGVRPASSRGVALPRRSFVRTPAGIATLVGVAAAAGFALWRGVTMPALPRDVNLAVLAPLTPGASEDFASFAAGAMAVVQQRLLRHADTPRFQIALAGEVRDAGAQSAVDARKTLGANVALISRFEQTPDLLRARLELRETARERVIGLREIEVPAQRPFQFLDRVYRESAALLRSKPIGGDTASDLGIHGAGSLRFYLQGLGRQAGSADSAATLLAVSHFESACRTEPESAVAEASLASALVTLHQQTGNPTWLARADGAARAALSLDSTKVTPHVVLGAVFNLQKRYDEAIRERARAAELAPWDDEAALRHARAFAHAGQSSEEREVYLAAIQRRPHDWRPHWWLATWEYRAGSLVDAIRSYQEMVRRAPLSALGHANLGAMLILRGDYDRAIESLNTSLRLQPTMRAFSNLGTAYFNSGRFADAVAAYNQSFQFGAPDYVTWLNLGDAYWYSKDRRSQAAAAYAQAIRAGRDSAEARARHGAMEDATISGNLAVLFARTGQPDSARVYLKRALAVDSTRWEVQYSAALTTWQLQDRSRAVGWLARSVRGGYPAVWLRDSPMFRDWREVEGFRALVADTLGRSSEAATRSEGG